MCRMELEGKDRLAEGEGFEPPRGVFTPLADFESAPFDHSGTPPYAFN